jgi:hypothetical protein
MNADVPYMMSVTNLHKILDAIQKAGAPDAFGLDFLKDLGFSSSNDRGVVKLLKYLGLIDQSGRPQTSYRDFMDHTKAKAVLAARLRGSFDDLFTADRNANTKTVEQLKGWFKTKTGSGDAVAQKMASTFKSLSQYADFSAPSEAQHFSPPPPDDVKEDSSAQGQAEPPSAAPLTHKPPPGAIGLVYRFEIHLPDTQSVDTYRAIFRALREELMWRNE